MATIQRKGPERTEFEIMDSPSRQMEKIQLESNERMLKPASNEHEENNIDIPRREDSRMLNKKSTTSTPETITPEQVCLVDCGSCHKIKDLNMIKYCRECKQTLCDACLKIHNRLGGTRKHLRSIENCVSRFFMKAV